jgi:hypothetical protein
MDIFRNDKSIAEKKEIKNTEDAKRWACIEGTINRLYMLGDMLRDQKIDEKFNI